MSRRLTLVVIGEERAPVELPAQGKLVIGSGDRAHLELTGQGVAEVHCTIGRIKGGGWALKDLGSDFGTLVNGEAVNAARLRAGDELTIGSRRLRVVDPARPADAPPAAPADPAPPVAVPEPPRPAVAAPVPAARVEREPSDEDAPVLGGYRIQGPLGRGAMGAVYLATQTSLDRPVALKVMKRRLASDPRFVERFQAEARAAAALNHPNVVTVFDVGSDGGHHYLSMEFMDSGSLEAQLEREGPLPWREVLDVLRDAAAGLEYAEARGIVHRDVKPENLMRNREGVTKLADLGLAVQVEAEELLADREGRKIFGTPHFIAPELLRGQPATSRSDLYSLGATAYRLLSGHTPFEGDSTREILRGALQDEAPPLGERVPGLPAAVGALVHRLLEKDPDSRHPSARVLLDELERLRRGEAPASHASAPGAGPRPLVLVLGGLALVAAVVGGRALMGGGDEPSPVDDGGGAASGVADGAGASSSPGTGGAEDAASGPGGPLAEGGAGPGAAPTGDGSGGSAPGGAPEVGGPANEELVEARAKIALLELRDLVLPDGERAARLRELAQTYAGTDTARAAAQAADELDAALAAEAAAEAEAATRRAGVVAALGAAAGLEAATPLPPGAALRAMRLAPGLAEGLDDPALVAARDALVAEVLEQGAARARALIARADEAAGVGDFEALAEHLREVLPLADLPDPADIAPLLAPSTAALASGEPPGFPEGYGVINGLAETARARLGGLAGRREELERLQALEARRALAATLDAGRGLEGDLRRLDLQAAAARVRAASGTAALLSTAEADALTSLAVDLDAGATVLVALGQGWDGAGWKRRAFLDPRVARGRSSLEAVGADADGVQVAGVDGLERIPWSAWSSNSRALDSLLNGRLERDWTDPELRGCAALLRVTAVLVAIGEAEEVLVPASQARFSAGEAEALIAAFEEAREWSAETGAGNAELDAELAAAALLADALQARSDGRWSRAVESLDRLLEERSSTLIVLLLSDSGSDQ